MSRFIRFLRTGLLGFLAVFALARVMAACDPPPPPPAPDPVFVKPDRRDLIGLEKARLARRAAKDVTHKAGQAEARPSPDKSSGASAKESLYLKMR